MTGSRARPRSFALLILGSVVLLSAHTPPDTPKSSLLLLIDTSGSMRDEVGGGNREIKIEAARAAALAAVEQASLKRDVEVAVLAFEGDCSQPVSRHTGFTTDYTALSNFINSLQPGGGTPMAEAVLFANRFMKNQGAPSARDRMVVLLADGQNDCGNVADALNQLRTSGVIFRHETVGFGIQPNSPAARDLQDIATASGGGYHHAQDATQLGDLFMEFVNTFTVIDMLGMFGPGGRASSDSGRQEGDTAAQERLPSSRAVQRRVTDLLGQFKAAPRRWGALAIDSNQGPSWGWAIDYGTLQEATERALSACGPEKCHIAMTFVNQCAAFAADQADGSTVHGWARGTDGGDTRTLALNYCRERGGTSCIVRSWGCTSDR